MGKSLKTITNVKTDDKAMKLHKKIHYNTEKINLNKQHNLAELSATSGRQRIRRQRREIMISDKLYSNHTVLIPSKEGVGGRSGLMVSTLDSVSRGFKTWPGQCVVFLGMTLYSHSASLFFFLKS